MKLVIETPGAQGAKAPLETPEAVTHGTTTLMHKILRFLEVALEALWLVKMASGAIGPLKLAP